LHHTGLRLARASAEAWNFVNDTDDSEADWKNSAQIKRQFGTTVDFVGGNRVIFDLGGNKYRLIVHVSYAFGRLLNGSIPAEALIKPLRTRKAAA